MGQLPQGSISNTKAITNDDVIIAVDGVRPRMVRLIFSASLGLQASGCLGPYPNPEERVELGWHQPG